MGLRLMRCEDSVVSAKGSNLNLLAPAVSYRPCALCLLTLFVLACRDDVPAAPPPSEPSSESPASPPRGPLQAESQIPRQPDPSSPTPDECARPLPRNWEKSLLGKTVWIQNSGGRDAEEWTATCWLQTGPNKFSPQADGPVRHKQRMIVRELGTERTPYGTDWYLRVEPQDVDTGRETPCWVRDVAPYQFDKCPITTEGRGEFIAMFSKDCRVVNKTGEWETFTAGERTKCVAGPQVKCFRPKGMTELLVVPQECLTVVY